MRGLLSSLPPTIVSRKWVCHLSSGSTCPRAAATPPSAMTVCALPKRLLQTSATLAPAAFASIAARMPAPPAPITRTSTGWVSIWSSASPANATPRAAALPDVVRRVGDDAGREQAHVHVGQGDGDEARPSPPHVVPVQVREPLPERVPHPPRLRAREAVDPAADEVPQGV